MREIRKIIIHCTDSQWGNVEIIDRWHKERGWEGIGYHYLILNSYPTYSSLKDRRPEPENDGLIEEGRDLEKIGAHCRGHNLDSIGIALVGVNTFSKAQIYNLQQLIKVLLKQFHLSINNVYGHYEFDNRKSCPNLDMEWFREMLNF
ncbi:N-acetylmuramoyl-L-alanine amidase family 2 [Caldithrix abyssi DSM 13497]|uniref:N-acetylmuramoyl-L-alanine amidase n=1 Tax=Caldithrix abyssi DSM 13497 TaxID=880073 RepID=H1XTD2_CALAY|nr:N-acetylmuramoyl-L-alanine amidase [Caldithrix abyssi]APF20321.1 N-acetylmuramoyl-L-alanine amidase [Caldithrix abyssi DSM 13497]EHO40365.1 N-acetylmuramoyl-L-alanine amidase family 2 [Caldithrix abyssi DSM 13497]EHO41147.1 N-acetylmuramoyl-L-alanine amidase family 2 [Caldithrix abyssi DSM 13497]